jgi:hypothetical protein
MARRVSLKFNPIRPLQSTGFVINLQVGIPHRGCFPLLARLRR